VLPHVARAALARLDDVDPERLPSATAEEKAMKLSIPGCPFEVIATMVSKPPGSRWKLSVRELAVLVVIAALSTWCGIGIFDRYSRTMITKSYYVGDLLHPEGSQAASDLNKFAELVKSSVSRDLWSSRNRSIIPFYLSKSVIVRDSNAGHQRVANWLYKQRLIQGTAQFSLIQ
jgi:hypothetical protein